MRIVVRTEVRGVHSGLPTWFRAACIEAAHRGTGYDSYFGVGRTLALALLSEVPDDIELDEWVEEVHKLDMLLCRLEYTATLC